MTRPRQRTNPKSERLIFYSCCFRCETFKYRDINIQKQSKKPLWEDWKLLNKKWPPVIAISLTSFLTNTVSIAMKFGRDIQVPPRMNYKTLMIP